MNLEYSIVYKAENKYETWVNGAHWQFLIIPEENKTQEFVGVDFTNSLDAPIEYSINGFGFRTIRIHTKEKFKTVAFEASFKLIKREVNPFDFEITANIEEGYEKTKTIDFRVDFEQFLRSTPLTSIPSTSEGLFQFDLKQSIFENLQGLNLWIFEQIHFKVGTTDISTPLIKIITHKEGVCQDFTHLFCALARQNGIPCRYVSGYLHQGNGFFGDSQMHAWAEAYIPMVGWVGFDPTNGILANSNHIKVAHGNDYNDCSPLKGVLHTTGENKTIHSIQVSSQQ
ncbi:transglutaminase-like domain-containing protein [Kriegella aquimaris]|uniref:Transglutaminase-like enzyme, putative cysteine protease n=1 Tax=Kriegella aquimaris TaxID=192904 RepID=A0A1G9NJ91_9FLAO|nr:transglutaminase family protein [Kriegella aquimaris]SDL86424.1 Transglutaminase-like enzyme, putative cysteine protease [Kriegella aquimaris]